MGGGAALLPCSYCWNSVAATRSGGAQRKVGAVGELRIGIHREVLCGGEASWIRQWRELDGRWGGTGSERWRVGGRRKKVGGRGRAGPGRQHGARGRSGRAGTKVAVPKEGGGAAGPERQHRRRWRRAREWRRWVVRAAVGGLGFG